MMAFLHDRRIRKFGRRVLRLVTIAVMVVWILAPFYFLLLVAVQSRADSLITPPVWFPKPDLTNFAQILSSALSTSPPSNPSDMIFPGIRNSAIVAVVVALANLALGSLAAYAFARYSFRGSTSIPLALLASQMVPVFALIIPYYVVFRKLGLTNTRVGIMIAQLSFTLPFAIWLLRAYVRSIPVDLDRAGRVDGCTRFGVFWRVILPLARPGLISVGLFTFMVSWNDFLFPLVLNSHVDAIMVQPAIAGLYNVREQSFGIMAAGSLLAALPTIILAFVAQRYLVRGLLSGTGKG